MQLLLFIMAIVKHRMQEDTIQVKRSSHPGQPDHSPMNIEQGFIT
jgi:hypothetical protein